MNSYTAPTFSKLLQADCLRNTPQSHSLDECSAFYNSDRTAGLRLAWEYYFTAKADKTKNQVLAQLQGSGPFLKFLLPLLLFMYANFSMLWILSTDEMYCK